MFYCISVFNGGKENSSRLFLGNSVIFRWLDKIIIGVIHVTTYRFYEGTIYECTFETDFRATATYHMFKILFNVITLLPSIYLSVKSKWPFFESKSMFYTLLPLNCTSFYAKYFFAGNIQFLFLWWYYIFFFHFFLHFYNAFCMKLQTSDINPNFLVLRGHSRLGQERTVYE